MEINKVIKTFIASDLFFQSGWGLLAPVFAIFIVQNIEGSDARVAGLAATTYWIVKSFLQIPIGKYLDKTRGEKDDFYFLVFGTFLWSLVPLGYLFSKFPWHIYFWQVIQAIGGAMVVPSWSAIFTRHIDIGQEASEWSLRSTSLGFGAGIAGAIGGFLVAIFGFKIVFILVGVFTFLAAFLLIFVHKEIIPRDKVFPRVPPLKTQI